MSASAFNRLLGRVSQLGTIRYNSQVNAAATAGAAEASTSRTTRSLANNRDRSAGFPIVVLCVVEICPVLVVVACHSCGIPGDFCKRQQSQARLLGVAEVSGASQLFALWQASQSQVTAVL